ncbi:MAG: RsmE family RNA methyltransferase [Phoenicibacter congonensis]|uniref:Ribosomal RNA small subunit methyltransferase E n=1 Tax=Phoenicibacter congonensis TaxID=1944646 RepID=A0AA43RFW3_9ACTN|nr:RsmE family RNA methyltransferase [Phoenicibacter congonensis]
MHHYFVENENIEELCENEFLIQFSSVDKNHIKAQRLKPGEHITVVDLQKNYFELEITKVADGSVFANVAKRENFKNKPYSLSIFQGISKNSKLDDVLRCATEIGCSAFYAVNMERSVAKIKESSIGNKLDRFNSIARSASMQSGRVDIPSVSIINSSKDFLEELSAFDLVIVFWEQAKETDTVELAISSIAGGESACASDNRQPIKNVAVVVGPEGGISPAEIDSIKASSNCHVCTLGDTILRTETAGIVSCAIVNHLLGSTL